MWRLDSTVPAPIGRPSTVTLPELAGMSPATIEMMVVLPAPLGPSSPKVSPRAMWNDTPSTAVNDPKRRTTSVTCNTGASLLCWPTLTTLLRTRVSLTVLAGWGSARVTDVIGVG